jgi:hypothetical protein
VIDILNDSLSIETVHFGFFVQEEVPEEQVKRDVAPRVIEVLLIKLVEDLEDVGLAIRV